MQMSVLANIFVVASLNVLANIFVITSLLCPSTLAKVCDANGCADLHDETSLLQLDKGVKRGHGRRQDDDPGNSADQARLVDDSEKIDTDAVEASPEDELLGEDEYVGQDENGTSTALCINSKYIRIKSGDYFRKANADETTLLSMGNYQGGLVQSGTMDFKEREPPPAWLLPNGPVGWRPTTHIVMTRSESSQFSGQVSGAETVGAAAVKAGATASASHAGSADFKVVVLKINSENGLVEVINKDAKRLKLLQGYDYPRVVMEIMRLETIGNNADENCIAGTVEASGSSGTTSGAASGSASACSVMVASFSPGTVIAYTLAEPVFDMIGSGMFSSGKKGKIKGFKKDQPCGYYDPRCGCNQFTTSTR